MEALRLKEGIEFVESELKNTLGTLSILTLYKSSLLSVG